MKKLILSTFILLFACASTFAQQIEFTVEAPASIAGAYGFSSTNDVAGWGSPDLTDTANAVTDTLMFVEDGTTGTNPQGNPISQEGCFPLINDLTGKIAVIWRNTCQFGTKILYAEQAGARAVIIINREPGLVNMAPGDSGAVCTIPAIFVEDATGPAYTAFAQLLSAEQMAAINASFNSFAFAAQTTIDASDPISYATELASSTPTLMQLVVGGGNNDDGSWWRSRHRK